jgi:hypothetical protein
MLRPYPLVPVARPLALALAFVAATACVTPGEAPEAPKAMVRTPQSAAGAPAAAIARLTEKECGATYTLTVGNRSGTDEFVVSAYPEPGRSQDVSGFPSAAVLQAFIDRNYDLLQVDGHAVGTWCEAPGQADCHAAGATPTCHLDISRTLTSLDAAQRLAVACNQRAIAWLRYDGVRILDDGGKGYGDGAQLSGDRLAACRAARGD